MGRYFFDGTVLYFSPINNVDLNHQRNYQYQILDSLTDDNNVLQQLFMLNDNRDNYINAIEYLFYKLKIYLKDDLSYKIDAQDHSSTMIHDIHINLSKYGFDTVSVEKIKVATEKQNEFTIGQCLLDSIKLSGIATSFLIDCTVVGNGEGWSIGNGVIMFGDLPLLSIEHDMDAHGQHVYFITFFSMNLWIQMMLSMFDGNTEAYSSWLESFLKTLSSGGMGYEFLMDQDCIESIIRAFSGMSTQTEYCLVFKTNPVQIFAQVHEKETLGTAIC